MDNLTHVIEVAHVRSVLKVPDSWASRCSICAVRVRSWVSRSLSARCLGTTSLPRENPMRKPRCMPQRWRSSGRCSGRLSRIFGDRLGDRVGGGHTTLGGVGRSNGRRVLPTVSHCYGSIGDIGPVVRGRLWMQAGRGVLGTTDRSWFPKPDNASVRIRPGWSTSGRLKNGLDSVTGTRPALLGHGHSYVGDTGVMKNL
ncbi:hypothetical protein DSM43518_01579 [Mycobacterium marinum]|uniref:Uncharacterized protein n=1 Tax=Mycobacterium marinum TaxID=1781 RepID=A0A3E2N1G1_MYCMR|nr:hypothetical protein MM1218R_04275 [Mycobacterium marinum]AXN51617.1 hypothetical protein CCUG20998_04230 [Mycobacterium marinum]RFZ06229.1 hypothetical protein DE4381_03747 [Mycobacterium marinum]RFZ12377.1 hypothetical protein DSM43518_01579 [Mycobacterium marinum]RFZ18576.1 hypothetical protein DSM44344_04891 [Mycobacterium marinum]